MTDSDSMISLSTLISKEDEASIDVGEVCEEDALLPAEADDEHIRLLLRRESSCFGGSGGGAWDASARANAIRWILKTKPFFGFGAKTAYLAVSYLDQFMAHRAVDLMRDKSWAIRLLSVACLSVAAKMEECEAPALSEFETEEFRFHAAAIRRMELLILSTLEWRMSVVTPFSYLSYFAAKLQEHGSTHLVRKVAINILSANIEALSLVDYRPSVIAAAAVLAASDERLTRESVESKISSISPCRSLDAGHVFSCYYLLTKEIQKRKLKLNQSSAKCSSIDDSVDAISYAIESSKRRRLQ